MAKKLSPWIPYTELPTLFVFCVPLIAFIAFSGQEIFWVSNAYDGWRIFEVISLLLFGIYGVFSHTNDTTLPPASNQYITTIFPFLIGLLTISIWQSEFSARAGVDAALYGLLAISVWGHAKLFRKHSSLAPNIAAWLATIPILTLIILPLRLFSHTTTTSDQEWHQLFSNIRMLDDALLPCLFLLWQRPAWLSQDTFRAPIVKHIHTIAIFSISTLYILAFWYDGARAILLSTAIGLSFIIIFRRDLWIDLRLPLYSLIGGTLLFLTLRHIVPNLLPNPVLRTGSSGRYELWVKAVSLWHQHPLLGVGGNNFVTSNPWLLNGHPHNIPLQFVSEYGVSGILAILLVIPIGVQIFKNRKILPAFAIAAMIAVVVDALFSGVLVYPLSQILGLWPLAWLVSMLPQYSHQHLASPMPLKHKILIKNPLKFIFASWQTMLKITALLAIFTMLFVHTQDLICINCTSIDAYNAPRFWQYGRALHLQPQMQNAAY